MHHDPTFWLIARAAGLTAYAVLTLSVLAGLVLKSRPFARLKAAQVTEVHRTLALTGLGALALHAVALAQRKSQMAAQAQTVSAPVPVTAAPPPARIVTLPPLVITRTS